MIRISQLRLPCGHPEGALEDKIRKTLRIGKRNLRFTIVRHSVDARKKPQLLDVYTVDVDPGMKPKEEASLLRRLRDKNVTVSSDPVYRFPEGGDTPLQHRPVVVGAGPAGLFCALYLAEHGYRPLLIERGRRMEERTADVNQFWETGILNPLSNVQFGEGGAGTFSDGKLNTQVNDRTGRSGEVLRIFTDAGAPESILYDGKPHIGTDRLRVVIPNIRKRIEAAGGEVLFNTVCTGFSFENSAASGNNTPSGNNSASGNNTSFRNNSASGNNTPFVNNSVETNNIRQLKGIFLRNADEPDEPPKFLPADVLVLAIGHSARDTMEEIFKEKIPMEQKQFAVGFRVAHPQSMIDESQYGISDPVKLDMMRLSASPYKLTARASSGRGVYSFCMCPGGYIVNASSEKGYLCVNGMSDEKRDSGWANSAIVITVGENEFGSPDVLAGMRFQRDLEQKAFSLGKGCIPVQSFTDFRRQFEDGESILKDEEESFTAPWAKGSCRKAPLHSLLPKDLTFDFIEGIQQFGKKIEGYDGAEAVIAGIESRTSSPVRITRGKTLESIGAAGLYPCGEGAGYAGGIMSAAMDGMRVAEAIAVRYAPAETQK